MTTEELYEKAKDMIFGQLVSKDGKNIYRPMIEQLNSYEAIAGYFPAIYWLSELYLQMVRKREITSLHDCNDSTKLLYWHTTCMTRPAAPKAVKILACYAMYMQDLIKQSENQSL